MCECVCVCMCVRVCVCVCVTVCVLGREKHLLHSYLGVALLELFMYCVLLYLLSHKTGQGLVGRSLSALPSILLNEYS